MQHIPNQLGTSAHPFLLLIVDFAVKSHAFHGAPQTKEGLSADFEELCQQLLVDPVSPYPYQ
jgi:hypothetical protein